MVSALDSRSSCPGSSPGGRQSVVILDKAFLSHNESFYPGIQIVISAG